MEKLHVDESVNDIVATHPETLLDAFKYRVETMPDDIAFVWMDDGEQIGETATFRQLWTRTTAIAAELQCRKLEGKSVVLLFSFEGLDFIAAFWACIISGAVAVPTHPPVLSRLHRSMCRFELILNDCVCALVLTTTDIMKHIVDIFEVFPSLKRFEFLAIDTVDLALSANYVEPHIKRSDIAFLQYTNGSTRNPKGVMVTQGSLLFDQFAILNTFRLPEKCTVCGWLPLFHNFGLVGFVVYAIFGGCHMHLMSPISFIKKPFRWLKLVSDTRSIATGGLSFAFELCVRKITDVQLAELDLSCLSLMVSGAEQVRPPTIDNFLKKFAQCGFALNSFMPAYGLTEATLMVSCHQLHTIPCVSYFSSEELEHFRAVPVLCTDPFSRPLMSCGRNTSGDAYPLKIVDTETKRVVPDGTVGEIWISGPTCAAGYYKKPEVTETTFHAHIENDDSGTEFLRSGDKGFFCKGNLYVVGSGEDLIIINGRKHSPQDIEFTVERHPLSQPGTCAAFSVERNSEGVLVCVVEANMKFRKDKARDMLMDIACSIMQEHELQPFAIAILKPNSVCKTNSGKIQRRMCKDHFLKNTLDKVAVWCVEDSNKEEEEKSEPTNATISATLTTTTTTNTEMERKILKPMSERAKEISKCIVRIVREKMEKDLKVRTDVPFSCFGMSNADIIGLTGDLEELLHTRLSPAIVFEYSTIELLARHLAGEDMGATEENTACAVEEPLAIVGMGFRFPGASSPTEFWDLMREGRDAVTDIPVSRFDVDAYFDPTPRTPGKMYARKGGFVRDVDMFDADFFRIPRGQACTMDPQQRLLLTCVQEAFDDTGMTDNIVRGSRTGVIVGVSNNDNSRFQLNSCLTNTSPCMPTDAESSRTANCVSYVYDLQGPSVTVDTACSSSLVALDIAARYIREGFCTAAVVCGANLILTPEPLVTLSQEGFLSPDGHCKTFDTSTNGFSCGEGVAAVVVKPLSAAHRDGDRIYAVVRATSVNQGGAGIRTTEPNSQMQQQLVSAACSRAFIAPERIQYVECHGMSTALGDQIEVSALNQALCTHRDPLHDAPLLIGSVMTNIGHLGACTGIAGLIKLALAIHHRQLPPSVVHNAPSPKINFDAMPSIRVVDKLSPWPPAPGPETDAKNKKKNDDGVLVGGVSSFGFGGTNVHAILSSDPCPPVVRKAPEDFDKFWPLLLSAKSENALSATVKTYAEWLVKPDVPELYRICPTAAARRTHGKYRAAFLGATRDELVTQMRLWLSGAKMDLKTRRKQVVDSVPTGSDRKVALVFCGQGTQWYGMARELLLTTPQFRDTEEKLAAMFEGLEGMDWDIHDELSVMDGGESHLSQTKVAQVMLFLFQVSLVRHLESCGVHIDAVIGHSLGEIGAACISGMLADNVAARLVHERAQIMQRTTGMGKMCAVSLPADEVKAQVDAFDGRVCVSCYNGPRHIVIAGEEESLHACIDAVKEAHPDCHTQMLPVDYVFHSPQLEFAVPLLANKLRPFYRSREGRPDITMYSTVTGTRISASELTPEYWGSQVRSPVRFNEAVTAALNDGCRVFIEVAPHPILFNCIRATADAAGFSDVLVQPTLMHKVPDRIGVANVVMGLWAHGCDVDPVKYMFDDNADDWTGVNTRCDLPPRVWDFESCCAPK